MATNTNTLYQGLMDYHENLIKTKKLLGEEFRYLQECKMNLNQSYEGQGAEEFHHAFAATSEWFEQFFDEINTMAEFLASRTENLKKI